MNHGARNDTPAEVIEVKTGAISWRLGLGRAVNRLVAPDVLTAEDASSARPRTPSSSGWPSAATLLPLVRRTSETTPHETWTHSRRGERSSASLATLARRRDAGHDISPPDQAANVTHAP